MTGDEVAAKYSPTETTMAAVRNMIIAAGAQEVSSSKNGYLFATFPLQSAETLLNSKFHAFRNRETSQVLHRTLDGTYSLPADLADLVDFVEGVRRLPVPSIRPRPSKNHKKRFGEEWIAFPIFDTSPLVSVSLSCFSLFISPARSYTRPFSFFVPRFSFLLFSLLPTILSCKSTLDYSPLFSSLSVSHL